MTEEMLMTVVSTWSCADTANFQEPEVACTAKGKAPILVSIACDML